MFSSIPISIYIRLIIDSHADLSRLLFAFFFSLLSRFFLVLERRTKFCTSI